jgi:flagellin
MALGVLNNLSAIYAENNLNNTSASLQTVLQQLSSGSRINSGADDSAGLSLVNGLQANQAALTQSKTNATEGVGLLQVADGALSQVTSLLDRAITIATEASNGTLNSSQDSAANQEYTSILSEINNIGSTTTYNQERVFAGKTVAIYTGDSSPLGSSIDNLYIRTLSSSSVGDTGGAMSYSDGQNNVFINLSNGGTNAAVSDSLNASGTTTIAVNYMAKGASGTATMATANITVGTGTTNANTAQGLINAINNSGLGLSATFTTAAQAGSVAESAAEAGNVTGGTGSSTGIEISGVGLWTGTNGAGEIGTLTVANDSDTLGGNLTIVGPDGKSHAIALGAANSTDTLANLATTINSDDLGVQASYNAANNNIVFTSANASETITGTAITDTPTNATPVLAAVVNPAPVVASLGSTLSVAKANDILSGTLTVTDTVGGSHTVTLGTAGTTDTLANLAGTISGSGWGITAHLNGPGTAMTFTGSLLDNVVGTNLTDTTPGIDGTLTVAQSGDILGGSMTVTDTTGTAHAFALGQTGLTDTLAHLKTYINTTNAPWGVTAAINGAGTSMTFTETNSKNNVTGTNLTDTSAAVGISLTGTPTSSDVAYSGQVGTLTIGGTGGTATDTLGGTLTIGSNTLTLGVSTGANKTDTLADLAATINAGNYGATAIYSAANKDIVFTSANSAINFSGAPTDGTANSTITATTNAPYPTQVGTLTIGAGGAASDKLGGTLIIGSNTINLGTPNTTDTLAHLYATINSGNYGVTASLDSTGKNMTFNSTTGLLVAIGGAPTDTTTGAPTTAVTDTPAVNFSAYYSTGISGNITDSSTGGGTNITGMVIDSNGGGAIATTSYTDGAGADLSSTNLLSQTNAQIALGDLNQAITDVAAMDGYIGAQINTLNSVSSVMSTQQENVVSAQNAIQATDYASATANMSKYEILSQTGIAALAQANSVQQEVTKLLQ